MNQPANSEEANREDANINRQQSYVDWIDNEITRFRTYHDHKEVVTWTALAFYVPAIVLLGFKAAPLLSTDSHRFIVLGAFVFLSYLAFIFLNSQFYRR